MAERTWRDGHVEGWVNAHRRVLRWIAAGWTIEEIEERAKTTVKVAELAEMGKLEREGGER